jgi:prepilin-type processing-associated H-X9-DG protein
VQGRKRTSDPDPTRLVEFEGGNVLYNDGHAEWKNAADTKLRWYHVPDWFEGYW